MVRYGVGSRPGFFHATRLKTRPATPGGVRHNRPHPAAIPAVTHLPDQPMRTLPTAPCHRPSRPRRRGPALAALLAWLPALAAAQLAPVARQEVDALLRAVGTSGCEFVRGGTAHPAAKAQDHLQQKFDYLDARGLLKTAEDFIAKAGTRSSMTGEAYAIRCPGTAQQASDEWLLARLKALRAARR